jgi:aminoglycoside 6'-N-acetyltransferase
MYRHASIDIALAYGWRGRGIGADAITTLAKYLFEVRGHHRLTIDPAADNGRAIRSYERIGFRPVGVMRRYERGLDGTWHDGLLMDLLPGDLHLPARRGGPSGAAGGVGRPSSKASPSARPDSRRGRR